MTKSTVTVDLAAIRHNVETLLRVANPAELWAVVKADGYGHGAGRVAVAALEAGASAVCVATPAEAAELRPAVKDARIVVLGPTSAGEHALARAAGAELVVGMREWPDDVAIHVKVDTGMGRVGVRPEELPKELPRQAVGIMTHLAAADSPADDAFTHSQLERFERVVEQYPGLTKHAANTAATLRFERSRHDVVRCGIGIYGLSPFADRSDGVGLRPAMTWQSHVSAVKRLNPGESTGYGRRFIAQEPVRIGLVPVGYADGFARAFNNSEVLVDGERCRVAGTPSMDSFAVVLPATAEEGSVVTIVGAGLTADEQAAGIGTLNYELACGIGTNPLRCERTFVDG